MLFYIPCCARRMVVAIYILKFLGGDLPMLEDMINDRLGTLGLDRPAQLDEVLGQIFFQDDGESEKDRLFHRAADFLG